VADEAGAGLDGRVEAFERNDRFDGHEVEAAALLGGLDDTTAEPVQAGGAGICDGAGAEGGDKAGDAELGGLLDEPVEAVALRRGDGEGELERWRRSLPGFEDSQEDDISTDLDDLRSIPPAPTVEGLDELARADAADTGEVVGLVVVHPKEAVAWGVGAVTAIAQGAGPPGQARLAACPGFMVG
jgi:hypothetical protein